MVRTTKGYTTKEDKNIDKSVAPLVDVLREHGIETFESCSGAPGHVFPERTVRFHGGFNEGFRALSVALCENLPVLRLRRYWDIIDKEATGPFWELTFDIKKDQ